MMVVTFHAVCLAWCFFRLTDLPASLACVQKWLIFDVEKMWVGNVADASLWVALVGYGAFAYVTHLLFQSYQNREFSLATYSPVRVGFLWGFGAALGLLALLLAPGGEAPAFIYFQF
jgi:hypothetical protein